MPRRKKYDTKVHVAMTTDMLNKLLDVAGQRRKVPDQIRKFIRHGLDERAEVAGSRRYFTGRFRDAVNLRYSFFQMDEIDRPDIVLNVGGFTPSNQNCYLIDHKYHIKDNYLYCHDTAGRASWELEIKGIERGETTINCRVKNGFGLYRWFNPEFLPQVLLLKMIEYKLSQKGYFLILVPQIPN